MWIRPGVWVEERHSASFCKGGSFGCGSMARVSWTPKVCRMTVFAALVEGFGPCFKCTLGVLQEPRGNHPPFLGSENQEVGSVQVDAVFVAPMAPGKQFKAGRGLRILWSITCPKVLQLPHVVWSPILSPPPSQDQTRLDEESSNAHLALVLGRGCMAGSSTGLNDNVISQTYLKMILIST